MTRIPEQRAYYPGDTDQRIHRHTDEACEDDDNTLYTTRIPTSVRRYQQPPTRTAIRVTHHPIPARASSSTPPLLRAHPRAAPTTHAVPVPRPHLLQLPPLRTRRKHWTVYMGMEMVAMLTLSLGVSFVSSSWQRQEDAWRYGSPRTYQCDANVDHGGMSHFTVENLHGHILIFEVSLPDLSKPKMYTGLVLSQAHADQLPAIITFQDINGDHVPDMIITVGNVCTPLINDHGSFRAPTQRDKINLEGGETA